MHLILTTSEQVGGNRSALEYRYVFQSFGKILRNEGIVGCFRGNIPATALWCAYKSVDLPLYSASMALFKDYAIDDASPQILRGACAGISGAFASSVATLITYPLDTCRTQWISRDKENSIRLHQHIQRLHMTEGISGFYRGLGPAIVQVVPNMAMNFTIYDALKNSGFVRTHLGAEPQRNNRLHFSANLLLGSVSGFLSKIVTYPLDTAKKRMQMDGIEKNLVDLRIEKRYSGMLDCLSKMAKQEGLLSWFKGLLPTLWKSTITAAVTFSTFEYSTATLTQSEESSL